MWCRQVQSQGGSDVTVMVRPFRRPQLSEGLRVLHECGELWPSRYVYVEVNLRTERDRDLDFRWATEEAHEVNVHIEGPTALLQVDLFLEALGETKRPTLKEGILTQSEGEPSHRLGEHIAQWKGKLLLTFVHNKPSSGFVSYCVCNLKHCETVAGLIIRSK
jgi:hypothetical protein